MYNGMKKILIIIFLSTTCASQAQQRFEMGDQSVYAIIKDTDGFVNVRESQIKMRP
jgi:hypothetical protein